jgi:hypothetical protein
MSNRRISYLHNQKAMGLLTEAERIELASAPFLFGGGGVDGSGGGVCVIVQPAIPSEDTDASRLCAWLGAGTNRTESECRAELERQHFFDRTAADARREYETPRTVAPSPDIASAPNAGQDAAVDEMPVEEFELDARGRKIPKKHQPWLRPATQSDFQKAE